MVVCVGYEPHKAMFVGGKLDIQVVGVMAEQSTSKSVCLI